AAISHPLAVTVPCDSPFLPTDLVARLSEHMGANDLAVAKTGDQPHPVFALVRRSVAANLEAFLTGGGRKIDAWYASLKTVEVNFDDEADAFRNINTLDELGRACITPIADSETVPVRNALSRVLAEEIVPGINVPSHDNSAMDGYAVRFADIEKPLTEIGTALAGKPFGGTVGAGECVRIMTGAVMPAGSDTVVIQEVAKRDGNRITVPPGQKKAQNVRYAGEDLRIGVPVLAPGKLLRPAEIGLIASLGIGEVQVKRRLRVAFFSTGDELASIGSALKEGEVYDSNRYTLHGMLSRLGVEIIDMGVVRDDPALLEAAFRKAAAGADAII